MSRWARGLRFVVRRKRKGRKVKVERTPLKVPDGPCQTWGIDLIHDHLISGKSVVSFRCLTILDIYSRFCLNLQPRVRYSSESVIYSLEILIERFGAPSEIRLDNGPEFRSEQFQKWAKVRNIALAFSEPGKPQQNGFVESFHSRFRYECLSGHRFTTIEQAEQLIEEWRHGYNFIRPHSALGGKSPASRMPVV